MPTTTLEDIECLNTVAAHALHDGDWSEADSALAEALHNLAYACPIEPTPLLRKSAPLCTTNEQDADALMQEEADDDLTEDHQDHDTVPLEVFETGDPSPRAADIESFYPYPFTMDSSFLQDDDEDEEQDMAAEDDTNINNKRREVSSSSPASSTTFLSQDQHIRTTAVCLYNRALCHHLAWREARKTMTTSPSTRMDDDDDDDEFTVSPETHLRHALSYYHEAYQTLLLLDVVTHIPRSDSLILVVLALSANTLACLGALGWVHQMDFWSVQLHKLVEFAGPARVPTFFTHSAFYHCAARYDMALAA